MLRRSCMWAPLVALIVFVLAAPEAAARHGCPTTGIPKRTSEALVAERPQSSGPTLYYGCARRYRSTFRLNGRGDFGTNFVHEPTLRLSGRFVAYEQDFLSGAGDAANVVSVKNLRDGRLVHQALVSVRGGDHGDAITAIVVKRNGSVAWITTTEGGHELRLMDTTTPRTGTNPNFRDRPLLVDSGPALEPRSLALSADRTTIYWRVAGQPRSAPLR